MYKNDMTAPDAPYGIRRPGNNDRKREAVHTAQQKILWGRYALCGAFIGAGAILPGISGGVLAVIFGVYRPFMELLSHPGRALREYWRLAVPLCAGWGAGFFVIAHGLRRALSVSETVCVWLFIGLIAGSVPALFRDAGREGRPKSSWVWLTASGLALYAGFFYVRHVLRLQAAPNLWWYNFCGALWGVGTVLPGFSAAPVMMALGLYQPLLDDFARMDIPALSCCLPGAAASTLLLARLVNRLFRRRYADISHAIVGVVCASALSMIPLHYESLMEMICSALSCAAGFALARWMEHMADNTPKTP